MTNEQILEACEMIDEWSTRARQAFETAKLHLEKGDLKGFEKYMAIHMLLYHDGESLIRALGGHDLTGIQFLRSNGVVDQKLAELMSALGTHVYDPGVDLDV